MNNIRDLLKHFDNDNIRIDICSPAFRRICDKKSLEQDDQLLNTEYSNWIVDRDGALNIDL